MSTLQDHKTRTTNAVGMLSKTLCVPDSSHLAPIDTSATPEVQLREISRRKHAITTTKAALERAVGTLRSRYQALLLFVQTQQNRLEINGDIEQFWTELQGDQLLDRAQDTIITLDTQLVADQNIYTSLVFQLNAEMVTGTANLAVTDSARQNDHPSSSANQESPPHVTPMTPSPEVSPSTLQPIQLHRVELPTFDALKEDITIHIVIVPCQGLLRAVAHEVHHTKGIVCDRHHVRVLILADNLTTEVHHRVTEDRIDLNVHNITRSAFDLQSATVHLHRGVLTNRNLRRNQNRLSTLLRIQTTSMTNL
ncbi:hypothetical protein TELCIR_06322 [Teladorsagia circumcincta]|uniref:Uncharacterized protein n=1 Tax=Teladorsagia circumcincta TaxID=45464 RepID=A0A2G9UPX8_TELCI|nr:hypothetical protein TELCIR_06322 [Teladorsagia circumcincta]